MATALLPSSVDDSLGARLARLRRSRRLSLRGLANRLRRDHSLILRWEQGRREPTLHDLAALARVFEVTVDDLVRDVCLTGERTWSSRAHVVTRRRLVGSRLQAARERQRLSVWNVYVRLDMDGRRLIAIEGGVDPRLAEARSLAALYGVTLEDLVAPPRFDTSEDLPRVSRSMTPTVASRGHGLSDTTVRLVASPGHAPGASTQRQKASYAICPLSIALRVA